MLSRAINYFALEALYNILLQTIVLKVRVQKQLLFDLAKVIKNRRIIWGSTCLESTRRGSTSHIQKVRVLGGVLVQEALVGGVLPLQS